MSRRQPRPKEVPMSRTKKFLFASICFIAASGFGSMTAAVEYEIVVENMIPGGAETGQPMTPPVAVVHGPGYTLFAAGDMATPGLELLAEEGMTDDLVMEAESDPDVYQVVVGDGPFVDAVTFMIEGNPGELLSLVTMLARSNDLITGIHDITLPCCGDSMAYVDVDVYDAGTEENTGLVAHIPFYGNTFVGPDEENPIAAITYYEVVDDPDYGLLEYEFPPSARITVTALDPSPAEQDTWGTVKSLFQ
ncbi:MAG: hypothetical protein GF330_12720 [Candidatus Eisenbacteria bacterium]|nr:hypothetical protein [Candidatus Eisenbacteria bacterium]